MGVQKFSKDALRDGCGFGGVRIVADYSGEQIQATELICKIKISCAIISKVLNKVVIINH